MKQLVDLLQFVMLTQPFSIKLSKFRRILILIFLSCAIVIVFQCIDLRLYQTKLSRPVVYLNRPVSTVNGLPTILIWTDYYEDSTWTGLAETILPCGCLITRDRSLLAKALIVIFHWRTFDVNDVPEKYVNQTWIWFHLESPLNTRRRKLLQQFGKYIDCWATYKQDSDFVADYGRLVKLDEPQAIKKVNLSSKPKYVAWMVSNCGAQSGRDEFVSYLSQHIPVDVYGRCGDLSCSDYSAYNDQYCWHMISRNYKFYLSLENSICPDYFTEKVVKILNLDLIPIVLGGADYDKLLPKNSFIDSQKFGSPKYLAMYLRSLATDQERYNSFFEWKSNYSMVPRIDDRMSSIFCEICSAIERSTFTKTCRGKSEDLVHWWFESPPCKNIA